MTGPHSAKNRVSAQPSALDAKLISLIPAGSARAVSKLLMSGASSEALVPPESQAAEKIRYPQSLGLPALMVAIELARDPDIARALLAAGASPSARGREPALQAAIHRRPDLCLELIEAGADVRLRSPWDSPLTKAVKYGRLEVYKKLVEKGASPWDKDGQGNTAPMSAAMWGQLPMLAHLLAENLWEDKPRVPHAVEKFKGHAALDPRACALHPNASWGSKKGLGEIAAALIDAARAIRRDREAQGGAARPSQSHPIGYEALYARVQADGLDLIRQSVNLFGARGNPRDCKELKEDGKAKTREWVEHLLATHPAWRLSPEAAAQLARAVESESNNQARCAALERFALDQSAGPALTCGAAARL